MFSEGKATKEKVQFFRFIWPLTRRGILASVGSVYNPLALVAPFLLPSKQILQDQLIGISLYPTSFGPGGKSGGVTCTHVQRHAFLEQVKALETEQRSEIQGRERKVTKRSSPMHRLQPILDKDGILRVAVKHPVLLPKKEYFKHLIVRHFH